MSNISHKIIYFGVVCTMIIFISALSGEAAPTPVFINEIHYDNSGTDTDEAVEIFGPAGTNLDDWALYLYNGNGGIVYDTISLDGLIPDQQNGFGTLFFGGPAAGIQNGAPDGVALVYNYLLPDSAEVIQFLSYEGSFTAADGPANGLLSVDIGVSEDGTTPVGYSLQLAGTGAYYEDFYWWDSAQPQTFGTLNTDQSAVPIPSAIWLIGTGLIGLIGCRRFKQR